MADDKTTFALVHDRQDPSRTEFASVVYTEENWSSRKSIVFNFYARQVTQVEEFTPAAERVVGGTLNPTAAVGSLRVKDADHVSCTLDVDPQIVDKAYALYKGNQRR